MFVFNILLYAFALFGVICLAVLILPDKGAGKSILDDIGKRRPRMAGWGFEPMPKKEQRYDRSTPKLIPSTQTRSLLAKLHKIEYDLLAEGTHDAFRNDPNAQIPDVVYEELDYMDARGCTLIIQSINYIRQHINSEPLEVMADFDAMLCRIIQRHEDEFNYPPTNFRC
jgi:hypothetical protein